jgi:hypothetical protein
MRHHTELLDQFHMKALYIITLPCIMNKIKFRKYYLGVNFNSFLDIRKVSLVNLTWEMIGIKKNINTSKLIKMKLINFLNNVGVICIMIDIFQTVELVRSTYSLAFFSILCVSNKSPYSFGNDVFVKKIQHVFSS